MIPFPNVIAGLLIGFFNESWGVKLAVPFVWGVVRCGSIWAFETWRVDEYKTWAQAHNKRAKWGMSAAQAFYFIEYMTASLTALVSSVIGGAVAEFLQEYALTPSTAGESVLKMPTLIIGILANTFNMYFRKAVTGSYPIGAFWQKYGLIFELVNWGIFCAVIIYWASLYSWWLLLLFFAFSIVGMAISSLTKQWTQVIYAVGMPIMLVYALVLILRS